MGIKCPWCEYTSKKYPQSAGLRDVFEHMEHEHPKKLQQYNELKQQWTQEWKQKIENSDTLLETIKTRLDKIRDSKPEYSDIE